MRPLSEGEARTFLDVARTSGDRFEPLYVLAITIGLRRGELLGLAGTTLTWSAGRYA